MIKVKEFTTHLWGVVDYMIDKNISHQLNDKKPLKILDPSCGSGIFLIRSFKKLIEVCDGDVSGILEDNIFGVDSDENAVNITVLALYITLLDYIEDSDNLKFPHIKNKNIIHSDFFDDKINDLGYFDVIIGNPPWFQAKGEKHLFEKYAIKHNLPLSNRQIAQAFIKRASDFIKSNGTVSLVLTSKILYNIRDVKFRQYLVKNYRILEIYDLTLIKKYLFKNTTWPAFILTYTTENPSDKIKHISAKVNFHIKYLNKLFYTSKDVSYVSISNLVKYDWLYKTMLVGEEDDFKFIKKLNSENISLGKLISNHPHLKSGVGFKKVLNNEGRDVSEFLDNDFLKTSNNDLKRYSISPSAKWKYSHIKSGDTDLVKPPFVLMKASFTPTFDFIAAFSDKTLIFDYNTFSIKGTWADEVLLRNIAALINSDLFKYYFFMTGNVGVEKNRSTFSERKKFPVSEDIITNMELSAIVCLREKNLERASILDNKINEIIFKSYNLSNSEINLIKKMNEEIIPSIIEDKRITNRKINLDKFID